MPHTQLLLHYLGLVFPLSGSQIDSMTVMAVLFVWFMPVYSISAKVGFEPATDFTMCAAVSTFLVGIGIAEIVGSNPTRSISSCCTTTVLN